MKFRLLPAAVMAAVLVSIIAGLALGAGPTYIQSAPHPSLPAPPAQVTKTGARRDYRIRNLDSSVKEEPAAGRFWLINSFTVWEEPGTYEGKPAQVLHREDRSSKGDRIMWEIVASPELWPYKSGRKIYTRQNKLIEDQTEILANHFFRFPPRTIHGVGISWAVEKIDLTIGKRTDYWFTLGTENEPWQMFLIPEVEETVTVPAGTFRCVKIRVEVSTDKLPGFLRMIPKFVLRQMLAPSFAWVTKDTHLLVKYQGKLEGPGSPEKVQELVKIR